MNKTVITALAVVIFLGGAGWILIRPISFEGNTMKKDVPQSVSPQAPTGEMARPPLPTPVPYTPPVPSPTSAPVPPRYTLSEVSKHADAKSCWTVIGTNVLDLTVWINEHPGGSENILAICGVNGTTAFESQHAGQQKPERMLENYFLGPLVWKGSSRILR